VASALSRAEGVLVEASDPRAATAIPLTVYVERLWSYGALRVRAPLPGFERGLTVDVQTSERARSGTEASL
jgi:hypothetical protein